MRFLAGDTRLALAHPNGASLIDTKKWETQGELKLVTEVLSAAIAEDGRRLLVAGRGDGEQGLSHWDLVDRESRFQRSERTFYVAGLHYRSGRLVIATSLGDVVLDTEAGTSVDAAGPAVLRDPPGFDGVWWSGRLRPRFMERDLTIVDEATGELTWSRRLSDVITSVSMTSDEKRVVALLADGTLVQRSLGSGDPLDPLVGTFRAVVALPARPDRPTAGQLLIVDTQGLAVLDADGTRRSLGAVDALPSRLRGIAVDRAGAYAAVYGSKEVVVFAIGPSGAAEACRFSPPHRIGELSFRYDAERIAISDGVDITSWTRCGEYCARVVLFSGGPPSPVRAAVLSADGATFAVGEGASAIRFREGFSRLEGRDPRIKTLATERRAVIPL